MKLKKLYEMQKALDQHIESKHGLQQADLVDRKILALLVEIGELANETRCFKFWSVKEASPKSVILEEYVDGVHFILSLGIACGFDRDIELVNGAPLRDLTEQFLMVYEQASLFQQKREISVYESLVNVYFELGAALGFQAEEVFEAYISKNEVNYKRQQDGY